MRSAPRLPLMQWGGKFVAREFGIVGGMRVSAGDQRSVSALAGLDEAARCWE